MVVVLVLLCLQLWRPASAANVRLPVRGGTGGGMPAVGGGADGERTLFEAVEAPLGGGFDVAPAESFLPGPSPAGVAAERAVPEPTAPGAPSDPPRTTAVASRGSGARAPADPEEQPAAFGAMRREAAALEESVSGAAAQDPGTAYLAAGAPFSGAVAVHSADDLDFALDINPTTWDYSLGALRVRIGDLALDVRAYRHLDPKLKKVLAASVGYFIVDPAAAAAADYGYKGLRDGEEVILGPDSPSRFAWPQGVASKVKISRAGDVIRVESIEGEPPGLEFAPRAAPVKIQMRRRVSSDGRAASVTIAGPDKAANEDAVAFDADLGVILVADGVGGGPAGRMASAIAKRVILAHLRKRLGPKTTPLQAERILSEALVKVNRALLRYGARNPQAKGLGTTVAVGILLEGTMVTANVGDGGILVRRAGGRLQRITREDSLTEVMKTFALEALGESGVDMARVRRTGRVLPEDVAKAVRRLRSLSRRYEMLKSDPIVQQALLAPTRRREILLESYDTHPDRNVVINTLGREDFSAERIDVRRTRMNPGDIALAGSDGWLDNVPAKRRKKLARGARTPEALVDAMGGEALRVSTGPRGPQESAYAKIDDITVAAMRARVRAGRRQRAPVRR